MCLSAPLPIALRCMPLPDADLFHGERIRLDQGQTNPFIERLTFSCEKTFAIFERGFKADHPQVQRSVIRMEWLSPLPTHSRQISVATTLIRVG